jgi:hypothetical protein
MEWHTTGVSPMPVLYPVSSYDRSHLPEVKNAASVIRYVADTLLNVKGTKKEDKAQRDPRGVVEEFIEMAGYHDLISRKWTPNRALTEEQLAEYDKADQIGLAIRVKAHELLEPKRLTHDIDLVKETTRQLENELSAAEKAILDAARKGKI